MFPTITAAGRKRKKIYNTFDFLTVIYAHAHAQILYNDDGAATRSIDRRQLAMSSSAVLCVYITIYILSEVLGKL